MLAFLLLFAAGRLPARSCSFSPPPLWRVIGDADLIVVARVEWTETRSIPFTLVDGEKEDVEFTDVHLVVLETWKGKAPNWIIASSEHSLAPGDLVLAMLQSDETLIRESEGSSFEYGIPEDEESEVESPFTDEERRYLEISDAEWRASLSGRWHPIGMAGMRVVSKSDLEVLSDRIHEALRAQANGGVSEEAYRAWMLSRAERRATRSDALEEMMFGELRNRSAAAESDTDGSGLTNEEMARIRDGFIAEPSGDADLSRLISFFRGHEDETLDLAVASAVEGMLARSSADDETALAVFDAVMRVTAPESPIDVHVTPDIDQLRSVWAEVLDRWGIPRAPALVIPEIESEPE